MRIVSDFKDYYDSVQNMGQDQSLVYVRKREEVDGFFSSHEWAFHDYTFTAHYIGFCGNFYTIIQMNYNAYEWVGGQRMARWQTKFFTDIAKIDAEIEATAKKKIAKEWIKPPRWSYNLRWRDRAARGTAIAELATFTDEGPNPAYKPTFFETYNAPVIVSNPDTRYSKDKKMFLNGSLGDLGFFKIKDAYTAFQDINMWLSNQAVPQKPIPEMSNEVKIGSKGFDKHSFRKQKKK